MLKKLLSSQLRINMLAGAASHGVNIVILAVSYPIYLRYLGYETYGAWLALGVVLSLVRLSDFGMEQAVTKLVAEDLGKGNTQTVQQYVATAILVLSTVGGVALVIILLFRAPIISAFKFTGPNAEIAMWLLPYIGLLSIYSVVVQVLAGTLGGLGRMDLSNYVETGRRLALLLSALPLLYFGQGLKSLLIAGTFSYFVKHLLTLFLIRRIVHFRLMRLSNISSVCFKKLLRVGTGLFSGSLLQMVGIPFNRFMLARYAGAESLPIFDIAWRGAMQIQQLFGVGLRALMPEVSQATSEMSVKSIKRLSSIMRRTYGFLLATAIPLFLGLFVFAEFLLRAWLRKSYVDTIPPAFQIMLIGFFVGLLGTPVHHFLVGSGRISNAFMGVCIIWVGTMTSVLVYSLYFQQLSPFVVCACISSSCFVSTCYLMWRLRSTLRDHEKSVSSAEVSSQTQTQVRSGPCQSV